MSDVPFDVSDPKFNEIRALWAKRRKQYTREKIILAFTLGVLAGIGLGVLV